MFLTERKKRVSLPVIALKYFVLVITYFIPKKYNFFTFFYRNNTGPIPGGGGGIPPSLPWRPGLKDDLYD